MKILLLCNTMQNVANFRLPFIDKLQRMQHELIVVAQGDAFFPELNRCGFKLYSINTDNRSTSILKSAEYKKIFIRLFQKKSRT